MYVLFGVCEVAHHICVHQNSQCIERTKSLEKIGDELVASMKGMPPRGVNTYTVNLREKEPLYNVVPHQMHALIHQN